MFKQCLGMTIAFALTASQSAFADNWGHWRGPTGNSVANNATPPTQWSDTKNVKWKVPIPGRGSGSPVIWGDKVFVVTAVRSDGNDGAPSTDEGVGVPKRRGVPQPSNDAQRGSGRPPGGQGGFGGRQRRGPGAGSNARGPLPKLQFFLMCFDRDTGDVLWKQKATEATPHQGTHSTNGFASASPCTDGQHVYASFGSRGLYCYTMDGKLVWSRNDFPPMETRASFGEGSSPTIEGDMLIVPWDHEGQSHLYALNKLNGKTIWEVKRDEPTCWATPLIVEHDGKKQIVMNGQNYARGYDLETGKELWRCGGQTERPVATAVADDGLVFIGSGFRGSYLGAFRLNGSGDIEDTDSVAWSVDRDTPDIASPLLSDGRLYFHKGKTGLLTCLDATTGEPHYTASRIPDISSTYASPVAAGGYIFLTGRRGTTVVIKDGEELEVVSSNSVGETVDATPAPVDDQIFIRGENHLFCIST